MTATKVKHARLVPAMQQGKLWYHTLTLEKRLPELVKGATPVHSMSGLSHANGMPVQGELLETFHDDHMKDIVRHWLTMDDTVYRTRESYDNRCLNSEALGSSKNVFRIGRVLDPIHLSMVARYDGKYTQGQPACFYELYRMERLTIDGVLDAIQRAVAKRDPSTLDGIRYAYEPKDGFTSGRPSLTKTYEGIFARLASFLTGFGNAALQSGDIHTAVRAYQIAGVQDTQHVQRKLRTNRQELSK